MHNIVWIVFVNIMVFFAFIALQACSFSILGFGAIINRCRPPIVVPVYVMKNETNLLLEQFQSLRTTLALSPTCKATPVFDFSEKVEQPPEIKKSEEIVFILDTSGSMASGNLANGMHPKDVALPLLHHAFSTLANRTPMSLWRYDTCNTDPLNVIEPGETSGKEKISGLTFDSSSSAARAILSIPQMIPSGAGETSDRPMNVILISDGDDSCKGRDAPPELRNRPDIDAQGGAICAAVRRIARKLPYLAIHVVALDLSVVKAMQCVKEATGSWFIKSSDPEDLRKAIAHISSDTSRN